MAFYSLTLLISVICAFHFAIALLNLTSYRNGRLSMKAKDSLPYFLLPLALQPVPEILVGCGFLKSVDRHGFFYFSTFLVDSRQDLLNWDQKAFAIWYANYQVAENSILRFDSQGLTLRDVSGSVVWTAGRLSAEAAAIELLSTGNLVLYDAQRNILWQTFNSEPRRLLMDQKLYRGNRMESLDGRFYAEVEPTGLVLYDNKFASVSSQPQPCAAWLNVNGSTGVEYVGFTDDRKQFGMFDYRGVCVRSIDLETNDKACRYGWVDLGSGILPEFTCKVWNDPNISEFSNSLGASFLVNDGGEKKCRVDWSCDEYAMCYNRGCLCPNGTINGRSTKLPPNKSSGCRPPGSLGISETREEFMEIRGVDHRSSPFLEGSYGLSEDECKMLCLRNSSCKAVFFSLGLDKPQCLQVGVVLLVKALPNASVTAFLKVQVPVTRTSSGSRLKRRGSMSKWGILVGIASAGLSSLCIAGVGFWYFRKKKQSKVLSPNLMIKCFEAQELHEITSGFAVERLLGSGGSGSVYEGSLEGGVRVAVKCLKNTRCGFQHFEAEVKTVASINHRNLVRLLGYGASSSAYYLVYEYVPRLSLDKWLFDNWSELLDWSKRFSIVVDVAKGLRYLHHECHVRVLHLDIKPHNILLDADFGAKICDFGLSRLLDLSKSHFSQAIPRGTPGYIAPEVLFPTLQLSEKADVYSFGIVLLQIVSGVKVVLEEISVQNLLKCRGGEKVTVDGTLVTGIVDSRLYQDASLDRQQVARVLAVGLRCVSIEPSERPPMTEVVTMLETKD